MASSGGSAPVLVMKGSAFKQEMGIQRALWELSKPGDGSYVLFYGPRVYWGYL